MPDPPSSPAPGGDLLSTRDAVSLLELACVAGAVRRDPREWRLELLTGICRLLTASVAAAFIVRQFDTDPDVTTILDVGFKSDHHKKAFHEEFGTAPFGDPLSRAALAHVRANRPETYTCIRADHVTDTAWTSHPHVQTHRRRSALGDCALSIHRSSDKSTAYILAAFRHAFTEPAPGSPAPGTDVAAASRFSARERVLLDALHRGIGTFYLTEEAVRRSEPSIALAPRLRETLDHLLAGLTERQAAGKMSISVHTVHGYVKVLYSHFAVSSRGELLAKWMNATRKPPSTQ
jgi:DNA-binding CsgD family transcriptional regulator